MNDKSDTENTLLEQLDAAAASDPKEVLYAHKVTCPSCGHE